MMIEVILMLSVLSSAMAQSSTSSSSTASSTSSAPAPTHTIDAGIDGFNFSPNQLNASVGDIIEFRFFPQNHSVARSAFGNRPCIPYENTGRGRVGFWSGFRPVPVPPPADLPMFQVAVNDTEPIFFYCSAPSACLEGMIGVVNPNSTFTLAQQFDYTQNATQQYSPQEYFPPEVSMTASRTTTATGAPTASATATVTHTPTAVPTAKSSALPTGAIVGIAIGGFAVAMLLGAALYMCGRQKTVKEIIRDSTMGRHNDGTYESKTPAAEVKYTNMTPSTRTDSRFSGGNGYLGNDNGSYRANSPPIDETTGMIGHQYQQGVASPLPSPGYASPRYQDSHEMESPHVQSGIRPYDPSEFATQIGTNPAFHSQSAVNTHYSDAGPHELAVPSPHPDIAQSRPFSFQESDEHRYRSKEEE